MRPENEFLLSCFRSAFRRDEAVPLPDHVDWNRFVSLCEWHNVVPLVYRTLPAAFPGAIPPAAMIQLRNL